METKENSIKKMCSFYVSDWHLTTMILPYISRELEKETKVETILENGIENNIKELTSKLNINPDMKKKLLEINWKSSEINNESLNDFNQKSNKERIILINGTTEKIKEVNNLLEKLPNTEKEKITIINCYDVTKTQNHIQEILQEHENIINTSGRHKVKEIFSI